MQVRCADVIEIDRPDGANTEVSRAPPRRIEIVFHNIGGRLIISGSPNPDRKRAWLLNLETDPRMTFHLTWGMEADLPATARVITDEDERRAVFAEVVKVWTNQDVETMTRHSPLIEVSIDDAA